MGVLLTDESQFSLHRAETGGVGERLADVATQVCFIDSVLDAEK